MIRNLWYRWQRRTPQTFRPVVLVTGCGSGIGLALAELLYGSKEYRVVITARHHSLAFLKSKFPPNDRFQIRALEVTSEMERIQLISEIESLWGGVNILINNAGISYRAVIEQMTEHDELNQIATNYLGPVGLVRLCLPHMRELGRGKIINVSSVSGMLAMPTMASYTASKYALEGMSEALWYETRPLGISVSLVQPGFVHSNSFRRVHHTPDSLPERQEGGPYADYYQHMTPFVEKLMNLSSTTPEIIARLILRVMKTENPPLWIPATLDAKAFYFFAPVAAAPIIFAVSVSLPAGSPALGQRVFA